MSSADADDDPFVRIRLKGCDAQRVGLLIAALHQVGVELVPAPEPGSVVATLLGEDYTIPFAELIRRIVAEETFVPLAVPCLGIPRRFSAWSPDRHGNLRVTVDFEGLEPTEKVALLKTLVTALPPADQLADLEVRLRNKLGGTL